MKTASCLVFCALMIGALIRGQGDAQVADPSREVIRKPDFTIRGDSSQPISALAYNSNGKFLAVAGSDGVIRVYDARPGDSATAHLARTLTGHTLPVLAIGFSDSNTLVSISADQTAKFWDINTGKLLHSAGLGFGKAVIAAIAPGQPLLAGAALKQVRLWNYQTDELLRTFEANDSAVAALAFTPDGRLLVIGTTKGVIRVLEVASGKVARMIDLDTPVRSLAASTNCIAVGYADGTLAVLKLGDQESIPELKKHTGAITAVAFSANGEQFASGSADKTVKVWDTETLKLVGSMEGHTEQVLAVVFSPDGHQMASGGADGNVNFWTVPPK
jgi:WD40 repeat protein